MACRLTGGPANPAGPAGPTSPRSPCRRENPVCKSEHSGLAEFFFSGGSVELKKVRERKSTTGTYRASTRSNGSGRSEGTSLTLEKKTGSVSLSKDKNHQQIISLRRNLCFISLIFIIYSASFCRYFFVREKKEKALLHHYHYCS